MPWATSSFLSEVERPSILRTGLPVAPSLLSMLGDCLFASAANLNLLSSTYPNSAQCPCVESVGSAPGRESFGGGPVKPARAHRREIPDRAYGKRSIKSPPALSVRRITGSPQR